MSESGTPERDVNPDAGDVEEKSDEASLIPDADPEPSSGSKYAKDEKDHVDEDYGP